MAAPREIIVNSLTDFTTEVDVARGEDNHSIWFRGIGNSQYRLIPTLYRHPTINAIAGLHELEVDLLTRFRHRCIPFLDRPTNDPWELLFLMQHFGVPTRLLDWSENPFVALYFAISSAEARRTNGEFTGDAAVWILNTKKWNGKILSPLWNGRIVSIPDNPLEGYIPGAEPRKLSGLPVAMAGLYNSPRIVAQRGAFTIFGHINNAMEDIYDSEQFPQDSLIKLVIPISRLEAIRESLFGIGYSDSMIYPDLTGLAVEINRSFGFRT